jgi:hypothetical protein
VLAPAIAAQIESDLARRAPPPTGDDGIRNRTEPAPAQ